MTAREDLGYAAGALTPARKVTELLDAYRAEVLREAADHIWTDDTCTCGGCDTCVPNALAEQLRVMADGGKAVHR